MLTYSTLTDTLSPMSRGLGKVERRVLGELSDLDDASTPSAMPGGDGYWYLTDLCESDRRSEVESARRALYSLRRKGLVETSRKADGMQYFRLAARLTEQGRSLAADGTYTEHGGRA